MSKRVFLLLGTSKGVFFLESDAARKAWKFHGPFCDATPMNHVVADPATGAIFAASGSQWSGVEVWSSPDLGASWTRSGEGLAFEGDAEPVNSVWSLSAANDTIYAGTRPAGLFRSTDGGQSWQHVEGLTNHPTRKDWPPGGAGLTLHHIVRAPHDDKAIWVGISSAGIFATEDGGKSWEPRNKGVRNDYAETEAERTAEIGYCVHSITHARNVPGLMYQQNHCGMYRSTDSGKNWQSIENGLPSSFGFPVAVHPHDPQTVWLVPMNSDIGGRYVPDAKAAVWRTRDGGNSWVDLRNGLPQDNCYFTVLRQAMAVDGFEQAGLYFGTNTGSVFGSTDEGDTWVELAQHLPTIRSVEVLQLDA